MKESFDNKIPAYSEINAPFLNIILSDPLEENSMDLTALVDTGYAGEILIPINMFNQIRLNAFEFSKDVVSYAETPSGEILELNSATGSHSIELFFDNFLCFFVGHILTLISILYSVKYFSSNV